MKNRKIVFLGLLVSLFVLTISFFEIHKAVEKNEYLVMRTNNSGRYDISTEKMTSKEAKDLKNSNGVTIVEKDVCVTASEINSSKSIKPDKLNEYLADKKSHKKNVVNKKIKGSKSQWNIQQIKADNQQITSSASAIKVCIIDSGVDYNQDTFVYARKDFIPVQDNVSDVSDVSVIYDDTCGHGTNIAGIIEAKANDIGVTGINPNVQLYSARVLDANRTAPVSRVVEAIYWAIDQGVNIINMSFGTTTDSEALKQAIDDAYNAGILIIASAGNNGVVEYPAAYDEVMAIGSVDCEGQVSDFSPTDNKIELVAPGELILSTGDFGGESVHSGTSLSAAHVTGVASLLWQKDPTVSASFIRALLDSSANLYDEKDKYGYGLVDLEYAMKIYENFKETYNQIDLNENSDISSDLVNVSNNTSEIPVFDDNTYVEGNWLPTTHESFVYGTWLSDTNMKAIKAGATAPDTYIAGMTTFPQWHGYWQKSAGSPTYVSNYMASYIYLTQMALQWGNDESRSYTYTNPDPDATFPNFSDFKNTQDYNALINGNVTPYYFCGNFWSYVLGTISETDQHIRFYLYGVALHSATDIFAHSTYTLDGNYISHTAGSVSGDGKADDTSYITSRCMCATYFAQLIIRHAANDEPGALSDFYTVIMSGCYDGNFKLKNYSVYANAIDSTYYNSHQSAFDNATIN